MGPILNCIDKLIENRSNTEYSVSQTVAARDRMDKDLLDLLVTIDNETHALCQNGGDFEDLVSLVSNQSTDILENFRESDINPTEEQLDWLTTRLHQLAELLQDRKSRHVADLTQDRHLHSLCVEGGKGYTIKFLGKDWTVFKRDLNPHPIPELQDRVLYLTNTTQVVMAAQREMAKELDKTNEENKSPHPNMGPEA